jgi:uncharacterized protein (TIGR00369 family)
VASDTLPTGTTHEQALGIAREMTKGTLMEVLGLEWLEIRTDRIVARIPVPGNTQPYGLLHGGATAALCETVGSFGTAVAAGLDKAPVGIQLSINHLRAVSTGWVTATGVPLHVGRTTAVWDMQVEDEAGQLIAACRLTLAIRDRAPGASSD